MSYNVLCRRYVLSYNENRFEHFCSRTNFVEQNVRCPSSHVHRVFFPLRVMHLRLLHFFAALFFHSKQWSAITQTLSKSLTNYQLRKYLASKVTLKFIQANLIRDFNALEIIALFWKKRNKCKRESLNVITFESYLPFDNNKLKYLTMIIMSELRHPSL